MANLPLPILFSRSCAQCIHPIIPTNLKLHIMCSILLNIRQNACYLRLAIFQTIYFLLWDGRQSVLIIISIADCFGCVKQYEARCSECFRPPIFAIGTAHNKIIIYIYEGNQQISMKELNKSSTLINYEPSTIIKAIKQSQKWGVDK